MLTLNEALKAAGLAPKAEEKQPEAAPAPVVQEEKAPAEDKPLSLNEALKAAGLPQRTDEAADNFKAPDALYSGPEGHLIKVSSPEEFKRLAKGTKWSTNHTQSYLDKGPLYVWRGAGGKQKYVWSNETGVLVNATDHQQKPEDLDLPASVKKYIKLKGAA